MIIHRWCSPVFDLVYFSFYINFFFLFLIELPCIVVTPPTALAFEKTVFELGSWLDESKNDTKSLSRIKDFF